MAIRIVNWAQVNRRHRNTYTRCALRQNAERRPLEIWAAQKNNSHHLNYYWRRRLVVEILSPATIVRQIESLCRRRRVFASCCCLLTCQQADYARRAKSQTDDERTLVARPPPRTGLSLTTRPINFTGGRVFARKTRTSGRRRRREMDLCPLVRGASRGLSVAQSRWLT